MSWVAQKIESLKKWTHDEKDEPIWGRWMISAAVAVLIALLVIATFQYLLVNQLGSATEKDSQTRYGVSGDFFGFANAVFSALAFAMIIVTLWMQKHELGLQREEIEHTRDELKGQKVEMQQQNASLKRQTFENTFFSMLRLHNEIVQGIKSRNKYVTGRGAFNEFRVDLQNHGVMNLIQREADLAQSSANGSRYDEWYSKNESQLGHYFRSIYNMLRYLDEQGDNQRDMYARLVRSQLSSDELFVLSIAGLSLRGRKRMKSLFEKYAIMKHLIDDKYTQSYRSEYQSAAFGEEE